MVTAQRDEVIGYSEAAERLLKDDIRRRLENLGTGTNEWLREVLEELPKVHMDWSEPGMEDDAYESWDSRTDAFEFGVKAAAELGKGRVLLKVMLLESELGLESGWAYVVFAAKDEESLVESLRQTLDERYDRDRRESGPLPGVDAAPAAVRKDGG